MKTKLPFHLFVIMLCQFSAAGQSYIDRYLTDPIVFTTVGNSSNGINQPRDLDFKPHSNELWVANYGDGGGANTIIFYNAGRPNQTSQNRMDSHASHFLIYPSAIAFSDIGEWGNANEVKSTASPNSTFMGPGLWSGDTAIYARVFQNNWQSGFPLGSHIDMLHQSPFSMGLAHDSAKIYWVFDGWNGNLCKYDFVADHGPGYDDHSAGRIWRYTDIALTRVTGVPSHMVMDKSSKWLYIVNGGPKQIIRVNTKSGTVGGNLPMPNTGGEIVNLYKSVTGAVTQTIATLTNQPCGIDYSHDRLIVGDYTTGNILVYNTQASPTPTLMGTIATGSAGLMGLKIGYDGKIWFVNTSQNTVVRIDPSPLTNDASVSEIISPKTVNFERHFHSYYYDVCGTAITPVVKLENAGSITLTSVKISYKIDGIVTGTFTWTGALAAGATTTVNLPTGTVSQGEHKIEVECTDPNGTADTSPLNDKKQGSFRSLGLPLQLPYYEDFESNAFPPAGWSVVGFNKFAEINRTTMVSAYEQGAASMVFDNVSGGVDISGQRDFLISPLFDLSLSGPGTELNFDVAHAQFSSSTNDSLLVLVSTNCGNTWHYIYNKGGALLSTASPSTSVFYPVFSEWRNEQVSLNSYVGHPEVVFAFVGVSNYGNNVYVDNVYINFRPAEVTSQGPLTAPQVYPNPSQGKIEILSNENLNRVQVLNILGACVLEMDLSDQSLMKLSVDLGGLKDGAYFVKVFAGDKITTHKTIIQH